MVDWRAMTAKPGQIDIDMIARLARAVIARKAAFGDGIARHTDLDEAASPEVLLALVVRIGELRAILEKGTSPTVEPIATEVGMSRVGKLCRCAFCGYTAVCTPRDDFYSRSGPHTPDGGPLACAGCMQSGRVRDEQVRA